MFKKFFYILLLILSITPLMSFQVEIIKAETVEELQEKINIVEKNREKLEKEIKAYQAQLKEISNQASTLQGAIKTLDVSVSKINTEVKVTENNINKTTYTIEDTNLEISVKEKQINQNKKALVELLKKIDEHNNRSIWEMLLSQKDISYFWNDMESLVQVQSKINEQVTSIKNIKANLEKAKVNLEKEKEQLESYTKELADRKKVLDSTKKEKSNLLSATKSKESEYQKLLKEKEAQKKAFDEEIQNIEMTIKFLIDKTSYPSAKKGIIIWPLATFKITQEFGGTQFAKNNPGIYGKPYHPGVDFGVPTGTKVRSVSSGVVKGFDNTDAYNGCYAWGKWILIEHDNGLSSLYAHLSVISVQVGQRVKAGDVIGYSGNTGVSTGPHLHFSLYATQGVQIAKYSVYKKGSTTGCSATNATGPFADQDAYLNPLDYFPQQ